jgi:hypothetical protein
MDARLISSIVFLCIFGSAMLGFVLGKKLPDRHLDDRSKEIVKLATGLIATLSALVLGLLVSSATGMFDQVNNELTQVAARVVILDRVLAQYGPETNEIRAELKNGYTIVTEKVYSGNESQAAEAETPETFRRFERITASIRDLTPQTDAQRALHSRAIQISFELLTSRWLLTVQRTGTISLPLLVILLFWLSLIFAAWGIFSPRNVVVATALLACALAVSGAVLLILEMDQPMSGWVKVSDLPMRKALAYLGE